MMSCYLIKYPVENLLYRLLGKTMEKIITDSCKMRKLIRHSVSEKPAISHIHVYLFYGPAQRRNAVQVLYDDHFEKNYRITARTSVVGTVELFNHFIDMIEVHCLVDLAKQMLLGYELIYAEKLHLTSVFCSLF